MTTSEKLYRLFVAANHIEKAWDLNVYHMSGSLTVSFEETVIHLHVYDEKELSASMYHEDERYSFQGFVLEQFNSIHELISFLINYKVDSPDCFIEAFEFDETDIDHNCPF